MLVPGSAGHLAAIKRLSEGQYTATEALLALCDAINEHGLTIGGLTDAFELAIEDGHDMALIDLTMASAAVRAAKERKTDTEALP